ncbi:hypothetical protein ACFL1Z_07065 [Thermodesulfobacteriota bacterium]
MEKKTNNFEPRKLVDTNVIHRKGYYDCRISDFTTKHYNGKDLVAVFFEVAKGKHKGFRISAGFYNDYKGNLRLTYLCEAVGISKELKDPSELLGKFVKLRVIPKIVHSNGRSYRNYVITRFHPAG